MKPFSGPCCPASPVVCCPYCGQPSRFDFHDNRRNYFRCSGCRLIHLVRSAGDSDDPLSYYRKGYYNDYADDQQADQRAVLNGHILDLIERNVRKGRLLDIGCGCGFFLSAAQRRGWVIQGLDPSEQSIAEAKELIGGAALLGTLQDVDVSDGPLFDCVTMINVLDHVRDLNNTLARSSEMLRLGGLIYLRFPNGLFHRFLIKVQERIIGKPIFNRLLVFHEYVFTPSFIRTALKEYGYGDVTIYNSCISGAALYGRSPILKLWSPVLNGLLWLMVSSLRFFSGGRCLLSPSLEVTALKKG